VYNICECVCDGARLSVYVCMLLLCVVLCYALSHNAVLINRLMVSLSKKIVMTRRKVLNVVNMYDDCNWDCVQTANNCMLCECCMIKPNYIPQTLTDRQTRQLFIALSKSTVCT